MKRINCLLAAAIACVLTLAACGTTQTRTTAPTIRTVAPSHTTPVIGLPPCLTGGSQSNFAMQCATPPTTSSAPPVSAVQGATYGIDTYGAGDPDLPAAFDCSYLSGYPGGKDWDFGSIRAWTSRAKHICVVWETSATAAYGGRAAGEAAARDELREADQIGLPSYVPLRLAVDTPTYASATLPAAILAYFQGAHAVLGARTGAYGSYYVIQALERAHLITATTAWQTVGWSYGHVSNACIYQYSINQYLDGHSVDDDLERPGCAAAFYEYSTPKPQTICFGAHAQGSRTCRAAHADVRRWQTAQAANLRVARRLNCPRNETELTKLTQRERWFASRLRRHPSIRRAHRQTALRATRLAAGREREYLSRSRCALWTSRANFFAHQITKTERKYS